MTEENSSASPLTPGRSASLKLDASELPRSRGWGRQAVALIAVALLAKLTTLAILGRPLDCECSQLWAMPYQAGLNSQTVLDPYSALHLVFGAVLAKLVWWIRPDWSLWTIVAAVIVSSTVWEVSENLPMAIDLFGYSDDDPLAYDGDSMVNSFSDTAATVLGAALALPLTGWLVAALAVGAELLLSLWVGDGFLIMLWRVLGL